MIKIKRLTNNKDFTIGLFTIYNENNLILNNLYTIELPYKNNQNNISCIPTGNYIIKKHFSPKFGDLCLKVYAEDGKSEVQGRNQILIHSGNSVRCFTAKSGYTYKKESDGCLLLGLNVDVEQGLVYQSKDAIKYLLDYMKDKEQEQLVIE